MLDVAADAADKELSCHAYPHLVSSFRVDVVKRCRTLKLLELSLLSSISTAMTSLSCVALNVRNLRV